MPTFFGCPDENAHLFQMKNRSPPPRIQCCLGKHNKIKSMNTYCAATSFPGFSPVGRVGEKVDCAAPKCLRVDSILGLQPRDKAAMLGVNKIEFFLEKFTWK